ncbi:MAG: hypothetical protein J5J06_15505 [Phycisphaerae bacterium]|nr:hypothetical protein [Phycisphaerae bacterium]
MMGTDSFSGVRQGLFKLARRGLPRQTAGLEVMNMETKQPMRVFHSDHVSSVIWQQVTLIDGAPRSTLSAVVRRYYRDQDGYWKSSRVFSRQEIPLAINVLKEAYEFMVDHGIQQEIELAIEQTRSMPLLRGAKRLAAEDGGPRGIQNEKQRTGTTIPSGPG